MFFKTGKLEKEKEKEKLCNCLQAAKQLLTSIMEKGPLGKKSPFTRKEESSHD